MQAEAELVGDVAEVAPAAGRAAIVHLKRRDDAVLVDLDGLGVLAADVEDRARAREDAVRAAAVAEDFASDRVLREGERLASVAGPDDGNLLDGVARRFVDGVRDDVGRAHAARRAPEEIARVARAQARLDLEDRAVVERDERLEGDLARSRERLRLGHERGARQIAEEVAPPRGALDERRWRARLDRVDHLRRRTLERRAVRSRRLREVVRDRAPQLVEVTDKKLEPKRLAERDEVGLRAAALGKRALEHVEARRRVRLDARDRAGHLVVAAAVGDAPPERRARLVEHDRLRRGRAEVDADDALHAGSPSFRTGRLRFPSGRAGSGAPGPSFFRASSIWRKL